MAKIKISDASPGDEPGIILLLKETWLATYPNKKYNITRKDILKKDWESKKRLEKWQKAIVENGKNGVFNFVAKEGNKIFGFCQVVKEKNYNELKIIYVLPEYQGRGIGKMLANKAVSLLDFSKDTIVEVVGYNKAAIEFYKKLGFVEFEKGNGHEVSNEKIMPTIRMKFKNSRKDIGLQKEKVELAPYNPKWKNLYKKEEKIISFVLGKTALEVQHIGSTAISGSWAKPIIDIAVGVKNLEEAEKFIEPLKKLGYKLEHGAESGRYFLTKEKKGKITHHLHIEKLNGDLWKRQFIFINYLKKNKEALNRYNKFKIGLAEKHKNNRKAYVAAKIKFIDNMIAEALLSQAKKDGVLKIVAAGVIKRDNKFLLLERAPGEFMAGLVELPGGGVDEGESLLQALGREIKEETGLKISSVVAYLGSFDYFSSSGKKTRQFNFLVETAPGNIKLNPTEHSAYFLINPSDKKFQKLNISKNTKKTLLTANKIL